MHSSQGIYGLFLTVDKQRKVSHLLAHNYTYHVLILSLEDGSWYPGHWHILRILCIEDRSEAFEQQKPGGP
jgi:hypothetical protein